MRSSAEQARFRKEVFHAHKKADETGRVYLVCGLCGGRINPAVEGWEADHPIPHAFDGKDGVPVHIKCHRQKTSEQAPVIAKSKRVTAKHLGIRRKRSALSKSPGTKYDWAQGRYVRKGEE